ncbi:uncharacterized protein LOC126844549 [Adelges cooleyi]|uniref:uncharacterized protein LOC126844549 n=1 Tax=Adelges cooleyi TaxID=133065 RepID=UPI00217FB2AD|nr:uncharacterized protein LOC126844549 [Adelges cooleyi]
MYSHTVIATAVFAILTVNLCIADAPTETFVDKNEDGKVYDVLYGLSENLSAIMLDPVGRQTINVVRENLEHVANDALAHNAIVDTLDLATTILTNPNANRTILNALAIVQTLATNPEFHKMVVEFGKGLVDIMSMRNIGAVTDVVLDHMESMLGRQNFEKDFPAFVQTMAGMLNTRKNGAASAITGGITGRASAVANGLTGGFKRMASFGGRFRSVY